MQLPMKPISLQIVFLFLLSCSDSSDSTENIRGHNLKIQGVSHAIGHMRATRYCSQCHGVNLDGGDKLIPSCYSCHGQNWNDVDSTVSFAPTDHSIAHASFRHHPNLMSPQSTCTQCHGLQLAGEDNHARPSCFLCHGSIWDE